MATKPSGMASLLATAEKKHGISIGPMGSIASDVQFITTGNIAVDYALGGGVPMGRTVEFFGPPSSGKTTLALQAAIAMQKIIIGGGDPARGISKDDFILYFDYEHAMDPEYAVALGLDIEHPSMQFTQPDTLEEGADFALDAFKTGEVRLALFDSVAAMNPSAQAEADSIGKSLPAVQAKLMKPFGVNLNSVLRNNNGTVIFINHEMEKLEMGGARRPGMPAATTTPGGSALKFFSSVRVKFQQIKQHKGPWTNPTTREVIEIPVATDVKVKVVKNKVAPPFREAIVRVRYGRGFDQFWTALQILIANKKIVYTSGRYYFHNIIEEVPADWMNREKTGTQRPNIHGGEKLFEEADRHPEWRSGLIAVAERVAAENAESLKSVAPLGAAEDEEEPEDIDAILGTQDQELGAKRVEI